MNIATLLNNMAAEMGLRALTLDKNNSCALIFDDAMQVDLHFAEADGVLHIGGVIGAILASEKPALMLALLQANCQPDELGEAHFALDIIRAEVLLCRTLASHELHSGDLSAEMLKFVSACKTWRTRLTDRGLMVIEAL